MSQITVFPYHVWVSGITPGPFPKIWVTTEVGLCCKVPRGESLGIVGEVRTWELGVPALAMAAAGCDIQFPTVVRASKFIVAL